ncbi:MAG TPA: iron-containing alcohol dehydrogenase [Methylomusa anaerophila]|uniref:NAD-dependent methanol dehydrogenase n=1 Tax=Methylomusa anaerophila TaxID=1930071 RepID=A0A348AJM3_9FIRM|nr:iron-containing alcohol dehydrogenase [Methylomusa anaerophila]BBB91271.1 NAD-dependent methanol dehydrogenase [Methylomusa anaerophila]HML89734.1 iron-containing alcohol dehydrogenase [Methylomusa anaerophila]
MNDFTFVLPTKVIFGAGAIKNIVDICKSRHLGKIFIVTGRTSTKNSPHFQDILALLENSGLPVRVFSEVEADPSVETVDQGTAQLMAFQADAVLAFGGGSPMDAAKSMSMVSANGGSIQDYLRGRRSIVKRGVPLICIPTTAGTGSEVTAAAVTTDKQSKEKIGISHEFMMPLLAIVDPLLHVSMPPAVTAATGIDALTHAMEAFVAVKANPVTDSLAIQAIKLIGSNLRAAYAQGDDLTARSNMALASLIAGAAFTNAGLGAVHGIAHPIGARFGISHGVANGIVLPYVMEYYWQDGNAKFRDIAAALGEDVQGRADREAGWKAIAAINKLKQDIAIPDTLAAVNIAGEALEDIVKDAATYRLLSNSPRRLTVEDLRIIVGRAFGNC